MGGNIFICALIFASAACLVSSDVEPLYVEPILVNKQPNHKNDPIASDNPITNNTKHGVVEDAAFDIVSLFNNVNNQSFTQAFLASLSVIVVSELGDKTFFIAAIMAMNHPRLPVFAGAIGALGVMHTLSAFAGYLIAAIPHVYTFYASVVLFFLFGFKMLIEAYKMKPEEARGELEEVHVEINNLRREEETEQVESLQNQTNSPRYTFNRKCCRSTLTKIVPLAFLQAFTMTFLAEWGDRSQIATVVLAANENIYGILVGGLLGHFLCTVLAILGGRIIASKISVKSVTYIGGVVFLFFAVFSLVMGP